MAKYSIDLVPPTKKQISWSEKRHTREAAEVLFSKSLYQKQSMVSVNVCKARFRRRISVASNAIQTMDNEITQLINYCLNCIRRDENSTSKTGLRMNAIQTIVNELCFLIIFCLNCIRCDGNSSLKRA
jgi:hypothetical protein